ncbi:hypothetical protein [Paenibacillus dendritiformis]|uniref:hypothetical protein n=1 Tax=Paenibacillus dendritiformis TaxID=130049 RepID=UPI000DA81688|nr:hypothetical protein [Paenibacillus dendritiformis]PZM64836.1 hypothetical protein DOE73_14855 [Paenibacillus dendritiformis]
MLLRLAYQATRSAEDADPTSWEIAAARQELALAWHQFDQAEPAFVDPAIHRLIAAEQTYSKLLSARKSNDERNETNGKKEDQIGTSVQVLG